MFANINERKVNFFCFFFRYSSRVNFDVACTMDFHRFPLDKQNCEIKFESFGYTTDQMRLQWDSSSSTVNANMSLDQFEPLVTFQDSYATDYYAKSYPGVILRISLQRKLAYHLTQTFIPSLLFVSLAWLSLLIDPSAVPGRVSMVMMTLLTIMHMFSSVRRNTPKVFSTLPFLLGYRKTFFVNCQRNILVSSPFTALKNC